MIKNIYAVTHTTSDGWHHQFCGILKGFQDEDRAILYKEKLEKEDEENIKLQERCGECPFNENAHLVKDFDKFSKRAKTKCTDADFYMQTYTNPEYNQYLCRNKIPFEYDSNFYDIEVFGVELHD